MNDIGGGLDGRLAEGTHINGTLKFDRAVQIDGRFEGNVKSAGKLILGPTAQIDAEIAVGELEVQGTLRGKVQAKNRLLIRDGGVVEANIVTGKLAIETGAVFRGSCEMPEQDRLPEPKVEVKPAPQAVPDSKPAPPKANHPMQPKPTTQT
jgi:cytoskeletal protein CcmA (bactofilin family)